MKKNNVPSKLHIIVFNRGQNWESIDWFKKDTEFRLVYMKKRKEHEVLTNPSNEIWERFFNELNNIGVFSWKSTGISSIPSNLIGLEECLWEIQINYQNGNIFKISGSIYKLPLGFNKFCEAVSRLIGRPFGEIYNA